MKSFENLHFGMDGIVGNLHVKAPFEETEAIFDHYFKLISDIGIRWERHLLSGVFSWNPKNIPHFVFIDIFRIRQTLGIIL